MPDHVIHHADCLEVLRTLPASSVDLICTDPPYGDNTGYGRHFRTIHGNVSPILGLIAMQEALRVLRPNRFALMFLGPQH